MKKIWKQTVLLFVVIATLIGVTGCKTETFTVHYYDDLHAEPVNVTVKKGDIVQPRTPQAKPGYTFQGWYLDKQYSLESKYPFDLPITSDLNLYAYWLKNAEDTYRVTFDVVGGTPIAAQEVSKGAVITLPVAEKPGHQFVEWSCDGKTYQKNEQVSVTSDMEFVAIYVEEYEITIDLAGGTGIDVLKYTVTKGEAWEFPDASQLIKEDYQFQGFLVDGITYQPGATILIEKNTNVLVIWLGYYDISYELNGGEGSVPVQDRVLSGNTFVIASGEGLTKADQVFDGWVDQHGDVYRTGESYTVAGENIILTAKWKDITFPVKFFDWDGTLLTSQTVRIHDSVAYPTTAVTSVVEFIGWSVPEAQLADITSAMDVYATYNYSPLAANNFIFTEVGNSYTVCKSKNAVFPNELYLPHSYRGKLVTGTTNTGNMTTSGFASLGNITKLVVPSTYTVLCQYSFSGCIKLEEVLLNGAITNIEANAFSSCKALKKIDLPESLVQIGDFAFSDCITLNEVLIPEKVNIIGVRAFRGCKGVMRYLVAENNQHFVSMDDVLYELDSNQAISKLKVYPIAKSASGFILPNVVRYIDANAFEDCINLTSFQYEENSSLEEMGDYVFNRCYNMISIDIPGTVKWMGQFSFAETTAEVSFAEGITEISQKVFVAYKGTNIYIPSTVKKIDDYAFYDASNLSTVEFAENSQLTYIGNFAFLRNYKMNRFNAASIRTMIIPSGVTYIGDFAFYCNIEITSLTLPAGLEHIGVKAFSGYYYGKDIMQETDLSKYSLMNIEELFIPASVQAIGAYAFAANIALKSVVFEENGSLETLGYSYEEGGLTYGGYAFYQCISLVSADFGDNNQLIMIDYGTFADCFALENVDFGLNNNMMLANSYAFYRCINLASIDLPQGILAIGTKTFLQCEKLSRIVIPDPVLVTGESAFRGCTALREVIFSKNSKLGQFAWWTFAYCSALESIHLPASFEIFGSETAVGFVTQVFDECTSLKAITVDENSPYYSSKDGILYTADMTKLVCIPMGITGDYTIPNGVISVEQYAAYKSNLTNISLGNVQKIGTAAFSDCSKLVSLVIPNTITDLGPSSAFKGCSSLKSVVIQTGFKMKTLPTGTFYKCEKLVTVEFEVGVEIDRFGNAMFAQCPALEKVIIRMAKPPVIGINTFLVGEVGSGVQIPAKFYLYVPDDLVKTYRADIGWSMYKNRTVGISTLV